MKTTISLLGYQVLTPLCFYFLITPLRGESYHFLRIGLNLLVKTALCSLYALATVIAPLAFFVVTYRIKGSLFPTPSNVHQ